MQSSPEQYFEDSPSFFRSPQGRFTLCGHAEMSVQTFGGLELPLTTLASVAFF